MQRKTCCICATSFLPRRTVGDRQKTCGNPSCQRSHKQNANARWRSNNPQYSRDDYPRVRTWLDQHPGYLTQYRHDHPEYVRKNREAQKRRDRQGRVHLDIQAEMDFPSRLRDNGAITPGGGAYGCPMAHRS